MRKVSSTNTNGNNSNANVNVNKNTRHTNNKFDQFHNTNNNNKNNNNSGSHDNLEMLQMQILLKQVTVPNDQFCCITNGTLSIRLSGHLSSHLGVEMDIGARLDS